MIGTTLGHYRIVEKIDEGGMGEVYRAHDERLDRDVAIKVLHRDVAQDADRLSRFEREAKAVAKLDHPNILAIHDFGTKEGVTYSATELLEGESLRGLISEGGITTGKAVEYARAIADGLASAHNKGIIHRDLKPENVFLTTDGRIKILDFGLAKLKLPEADLTTETPTATLDTSPGGLIGTVPYMAPEQVQGQPADNRSDIFALGVVLYEMLTGQRPFGGSTTVETAAAILKEDPEPILVAAPAVPSTLGSVVSKCLEKRPEDRFSSAHDLSLTLGAVDTSAPARPIRDQSIIAKRWPHILAVVIATAIALFFVFPPEGLFERLAEQPAEVAPPRIVVLPFENMGSPEDEFFADGITEEITSRLAAVSGLQVISRTSAMYYKGKQVPLRQIGDELHVGYVLTGTIRWDREGGGHGRVRITPQLIKVADDSHLWSDRYDRELKDIFGVQSDIATQVIGGLRVILLDSERKSIEYRPTDDMSAYQAYLLGTQLIRGDTEEFSQRHAVEMLERAVKIDPAFAVGHAMLSRAHSRLYFYHFDFSEERLGKARLSAERAFELLPTAPEVHLALGYYHYWGRREYDLALEEFSSVLRSQPNNPEGLEGLFYLYRRTGRWQDALQAIERIRHRDPQSYRFVWHAHDTYQLVRDYESAERALRRAIELAPDRHEAYADGAWTYCQWDGSTKRARRLLDSAPTLDSRRMELTAIQLDLFDRDYDAALARIESVSAQAISLQLRYVPKDLIRCLCLPEIGRVDQGIQACEKAVGTLRKESADAPHDYRLHIALGHALAKLGRDDEAVQAGELGANLMPISKDAIDGTFQSIELAKIYAQTGRANQALDLIDELLSMPSSLSVGLLRLDPVWDPLRDHPRFHALLEQFGTD